MMELLLSDNVTQSCLTLCDPMNCSLPGFSFQVISQARLLGCHQVGCHSFLQDIILTQRSNLGFLHCRWILSHLSHQGSPLLSEGRDNCYLFFIWW